MMKTLLFSVGAGALLVATPMMALAASDDVNAAPASMTLVTISAVDLAAALAEGKVQLIDVRTPEEFAEGHIAGAINMPVDDFDPASVVDVDGKITILYCRSGRRSTIAGEKLAAYRGTATTHLDGGILAWQAAELPVTAP